MHNIRVKQLRPGAKLPTYGTAGAAGADLYACLEEDAVILPGQTRFLPTGIALEVPNGDWPRRTRWGWWTATTGGRSWWPCITTATSPRSSVTVNGSPKC